MNIKFGVFWKQNLGTIYKDNSITTLGKEADVDLNLSEVSSIHANFKVDGKNYTSIVYIVDIENGLIRIPFTREVLSIGMHELELVAVMKNGDVIPSQTFTYNIVESLDNLEDITEETNYPILIQLLQDVNSKIAEIDDAIARIPSPEELKGEKGDKGEKGEQGIQGERGLQGIQGIRGEKGDKGDRGLQGIQGVKGEKGDKGERGERGLQGIQGNQGARGIQGEKGDKGETGVGLGFEWSGTRLGIKKDTDISYKYVELKGEKGEQGVKGEKGDTPSITHLEKQVSDKSKELDTKFNTLTSKQQQDAEVVTARDGEVSLHARLERDLAKGKIHFVDIEGSNISTESEEGYLENVEIYGNTWQNAENLADIRSVGTKVEGQELYEIPVLSCGKNLLDDNKSTKSTLISVDDGSLWDTSQYNTSDYIKVIAGKKYQQTGSSLGWYHVLFDLNKRYVKRIDFPFTATENGYIRVSYKVTEAHEVQIEEGTQTTPYEPYQEDKLTILSPTPLEKVGDIADRIICKDGVFGVEKNIKTTKLKRTTKWTWYTDNLFKYCSTDTHITDSSSGNVMSDIGVNIWINNVGTVRDYSTVDNIEYLNSLDSFIVKYPTTQPQFIPLPHDQQIKLRTFADRTHIHSDTEIQPTLKAQVPKSLGATVNTHTTQIDNLNKELDRVKKLEESTVSTVTSDKAFTTVSETTQGYFEDVKIEGKTLVNLIKDAGYPKSLSKGNTTSCKYPYNRVLEVDKTYTLICKISNINEVGDNRPTISFNSGVNGPGIRLHNGLNVITFTNQYKLNSDNQLWIFYAINSTITSENPTVDYIVLLEGDHTDKDLNFFEGLKSVGQDSDEISVSSVNENLFDGKMELGDIFYSNGNNNDNHFDSRSRSVNYIRIGANKTYYIDKPLVGMNVATYDHNKKFISTLVINTNINKFTTPANCSYIRLMALSTDINYKYQIKVSNNFSNYIEPKANKKQILYFNPTTQTWEKPILREWDSIEKHSDGKYYYHKRSDEIVLNGTLGNVWLYNATINGVKNWYCEIIKDRVKPKSDIICDTLKQVTISQNIKGIRVGETKNITILLNENDISSNNLNDWLQANPTTVVYQLEKEEVYECTNLDLITYSNETNLIVNSGAIQPKLELKVHSNISNVVKLLQEKVSILENKFIKGLQQVLAGDMMSLAHLLYPEDFENNHEIQTLEL